MELNTLYMFKAVMDSGNFSKAADALFTTQSNVSKQVKNLEAYLGVPLFVRGNKGVSPTKAAHLFYEQLQIILPLLDDSISKVQQIVKNPKFILKMGIADSMSMELFTPLFKALRDSYPEVDLQIGVFSREELVRQLHSGEIDVAVLFSVWQIQGTQWVRKAYSRTNPCLYYAKTGAFLDKNPRIEDFQNSVFVRPRHSKATLFNLFDDLPFVPQKILEVNSVRTVQAYVSAGIACALLGKSQLLLDNSNIGCIEIPSRNKVGADLVWDSGNPNKAVQFLRACLKEMEPM